MPVRLFVAVLVVLVVVACSSAGETATSAPADDVSLRDYLSANGLLNRGLHELACKEYRKFLAEHATHEKAPLARYGLGVALYRLQRLDEAESELVTLAERPGFEFASEVQVLLGQCWTAQKKYEQAAQAFGRALERKPPEALAGAAAAGRVEALYREGRHDDVITESARPGATGAARQRIDLFVGLSQTAKHDDAGAARTFEGIIRGGGDAATVERATLLLAQCEQRLGRMEPAATHYRAVLARTDSPLAGVARAGLAGVLAEGGASNDAVEILNDLIAKGGTAEAIGELRMQRGRAYFDLKQYKKALRDFDDVAKSGEANADGAAYWAAKCFLRTEQAPEAAERLAAAIERFPKSKLLAEMSYDRAVALWRAGEIAGALRVLNESGARFDKHELAAAVLQLTAELEHQQRHYDKSLAACRAYLKDYGGAPQAAAVEFLAAENLYLAGELQGSVDALRAFLKKHGDDGNATKARFRLGLALHRLNKFDEARAELAPLAAEAEKQPDLRPALQVLADLAFQQGEWADAARGFEQFLRSSDESTGADQALLMLGLARSRQGQWAPAIESYERLLSQFSASPHRVQAEFERGQALLELKKSKEAEAAFERVLADGADSRFAPYARTHLAAIAAARGDSQRAESLLEAAAAGTTDEGVRTEALFRQAQTLAAAGSDADAEAALRRFLKDHAADERAGVVRAQLMIAMARQKKCSDVAGQIDVVLKDSGGLDAGLVDALRYEKAWCLRSLGRTDEAAAAYRTHIDSGGGILVLSSMLELAELEADRGQHETSRKLLSKLRERTSRDDIQAPGEVLEQAAYRLAVCEYKLDHHSDAATLFGEFVANYPESKLMASACFFAGECNYRAGRQAEAVKYLERVNKEFAASDVCGPALLRLGDAAAALQEWPRSERAFRTWLERFGNQESWYQAQFGVGWALENQAKHERAIDAYRKVVAKHQGPTAARAQFQIGECLFAIKKYDDAAAELLKVDILYAYPEWSAAGLYEAGRCFEELGKSAEARTQFKTVADKFKNTRWAALAQERMLKSPAAVPGH